MSGMHGGGHPGKGKPEGALMKQGEEKGSGESLTPPPGAQPSPASHSHQER
jgi:cytochrome o ubiquinol oxidase subunit 2